MAAVNLIWNTSISNQTSGGVGTLIINNNAVGNTSGDIRCTSFTQLSRQLSRVITRRDNDHKQQAAHDTAMITSCITSSINYNNHTTVIPLVLMDIIMGYYGTPLESRHRTLVVSFTAQAMPGGWQPGRVGATFLSDGRHILTRDQRGGPAWQKTVWRLWHADVALGPRFIPAIAVLPAATSPTPTSSTSCSSDTKDSDDQVTDDGVVPPSAIPFIDNDDSKSMEACLHHDWRIPYDPTILPVTCDDVWSAAGWNGVSLIHHLFDGRSSVIVSAPTTTVFDGRHQLYGIHEHLHPTGTGDRGLLYRMVNTIINQCRINNDALMATKSDMEYIITLSMVEFDGTDMYDGIDNIADPHARDAMDRKKAVKSVLDRLYQLNLDAGIDRVMVLIKSLLTRTTALRPNTMSPLRAYHALWSFTCYKQPRREPSSSSPSASLSASSLPLTSSNRNMSSFDNSNVAMISRILLVDLLPCETSVKMGASRDIAQRINAMNQVHTSVVNTVTQLRLLEAKRSTSSLAQLRTAAASSSSCSSWSVSSAASAPSATRSTSAQTKVKSAAKKQIASSSSTRDSPMSTLFRAAPILQCLKSTLLSCDNIIMSLFIDVGHDDLPYTCNALRTPLTPSSWSASP